MLVLFIKLISSDRINMGAANSTNNNLRFFQPQKEVKKAPKPFDDKSSEFVKDMSNPDNLTPTEKYIEKQKTNQGVVINGKCSEHLNKINKLEKKIKELEESCGIDRVMAKDNRLSAQISNGVSRSVPEMKKNVLAKDNRLSAQIETRVSRSVPRVVEGYSNVDDNSFLFMLIGIIIIYRFMQK